MKTFKLCLFIYGLFSLSTYRALADTWTYKWVDQGWTTAPQRGTTAAGPHAGFSSSGPVNPLMLTAWGGNSFGSQGPFEFAVITETYDHSYILLRNGVPATSNPGISITVQIQGVVSVTSDSYGSGAGSFGVTSGPPGAVLGNFSSGSVSGNYTSGTQVVASWSSNTAVSATFHVGITATAQGDGSAVTTLLAKMFSP